VENGRIVKLNHAGLYGFIKAGREQIFFHHSGLLNRQFSNLATGYPVEFSRVMDRASGKVQAINVRVL
jgi:cold shock CspA family protein